MFVQWSPALAVPPMYLVTALPCYLPRCRRCGRVLPCPRHVLPCSLPCLRRAASGRALTMLLAVRLP
eukprot:6820201-Lingulodinium_polyedra.AAC.1